MCKRIQERLEESYKFNENYKIYKICKDSWKRSLDGLGKNCTVIWNYYFSERWQRLNVNEIQKSSKETYYNWNYKILSSKN